MPETALGPGPEFERIRQIAKALGSAGADLGDDCALLPFGERTLAVSTDASVEDVHFRRAWLAPEEIGWRAATAALSDLAAVGAEPLGVLVALGLPAAADPGLAAAVMRGAGQAASAVATRIVGGDLTTAPSLGLAVTVIGVADRPVRRRGARVGDGVWVTGTLGGARAALAAWRAGREPFPAARIRFAHPDARMAAGAWLAKAGATAMLDVSDGLAGDAEHLAAASAVALDIALEQLPLGPGVADAARAAGESPAEFAARGGEDYELLVTLPADFSGASAGAVSLTRIGTVAAGTGVRLTLDGRLRRLASFDHFA